MMSFAAHDGNGPNIAKSAVLPNVFRNVPGEFHHLIDDIASRADDFLEGTHDRRQARAGIEEFLTLEHSELPPPDRKKVVDGVMAVLEAEDFFGTEFVGDPFQDDDSDEA